MHSSDQFPQPSMLAQLIRSSPPQGIERSTAVGMDDGLSEHPPHMTVSDTDAPSFNEQSTLLRKNTPYISHTIHLYGTVPDLEGQAPGREVSCWNIAYLFPWPRTAAVHAFRTVTSSRSWSLKGLWEQGCVRPVRYVPAVLLGLLLNILDALSYGWHT